MKVSNFRMKELLGNGSLNWFAVAEVDVETGILFWKKTKTREITQRFAGYGWIFSDTGEAAGFAVLRAVSAWESKNRKRIWEFK